MSSGRAPARPAKGTSLPLRCQRGADHTACREAHDAHALGIDMPLVGIRTNRGDHLGKICLGVRKAHVTRATRHIVEHKGLVRRGPKNANATGSCSCGAICVKPASAADDHRGAAAIGLVGQRLGTQIRKRRRIILGRLLAPQCMALGNHMCSLRANYAPLFFAFKRTPLEPVAQKHSSN